MAHSRRVAGVRSWSLGLLLVASGLTAACSSSDPMVATWTANIAPPGMNVDPIKLELKDDGTYTTTRSTCTESGTWSASGGSLITKPTAGTCGGTNTQVRYSLSADQNTLFVMSANFGVVGVSLVLMRGMGTLPNRPPTPGGVTATITNHANGEITVSWTAATGAAAYNVIYSGSWGSRTQGVVTGTSAVITIMVSGASNWEGNTSFSVVAISAGGSSEATAIVKG